MPALNSATIGTFLVGAIIAGCLLAVAHLALYSFRDSMHRVANYTIGTVCLLLGYTVSCGMLGAWVFVVGVWLTAGVGGIVIACAWWVRGLRKAPTLAAASAALEERHGPAGRSDHRRN